MAHINYRELYTRRYVAECSIELSPAELDRLKAEVDGLLAGKPLATLPAGVTLWNPPGGKQYTLTRDDGRAPDPALAQQVREWLAGGGGPLLVLPAGYRLKEV